MWRRLLLHHYTCLVLQFRCDNPPVAHCVMSTVSLRYFGAGGLTCSAFTSKNKCSLVSERECSVKECKACYNVCFLQRKKKYKKFNIHISAGGK